MLKICKKTLRHLSYSSMGVFFRCPTQLWFKHVVGYPPDQKPAARMKLGLWGHAALEKYFKRKMREQPVDLGDVTGEFERHYMSEANNVDWEGDDPGWWKKKYVDELLPKIYEEHLTSLVPEFVEKYIRVTVERTDGKSPIVFVGYVDFGGKEKGKKTRIIRDFKFRGSAKSEAIESRDLQLPLYVLGLSAHQEDCTKAKCSSACEAYEVSTVSTDQFCPQKTQSKIVTFKRKVTEDQKQRALHAMEHVIKQIERAGDNPNNWGKNTEGWWCSEKMCQWFKLCPQGGGGDHSV